MLNSDGSASGYLCILRNLQTVKSLQRQIRLNERLAALSNMAAGVAHEIRNPLSTLKGYATYLSEKLKNDPQAHAMGTLMIEEVERLNRVVTDLLFLSKPSQLQFSPVNLAEIVAKAVRLVAFDAYTLQVKKHRYLFPVMRTAFFKLYSIFCLMPFKLLMPIAVLSPLICIKRYKKKLLPYQLLQSNTLLFVFETQAKV